MRMRDDAPHSRAHALDQLQIVRRVVAMRDLAHLCAHAVDAMREIALRLASKFSRMTRNARELVACHRASAPSLVRIEQVHRRRTERGGDEKAGPIAIGI